ncbi:MAG: tRNA lysidine(34) synthetase TilS, partial [Christensenellales bacterium]
MSLPSAVLHAIKQHALLAPRETVLVALSGGADSMALLHILWKLQKTLDISLTAAHVHHGLRAAADGDAVFSRTFCEKLGIAFTLSYVDTPAHIKKTRQSVEEAARTLRYQALNQAADACSAQKIALGHHKDDQAETVLLHLLRGSGIQGLCGMPKKRGRLIRPLLSTSKEEILAYCAAHNIPFLQDETNQSLRFRRNSIRHELLPFLQKHYNPNITDALCRSADLLAEENAYLNELAHQSFRSLSDIQKDGLAFSTDALGQQPLALKRRVLRIALSRLGSLKNLRQQHVDAVLALRSGSIPLPGGVLARESSGMLLLSQSPASEEAPWSIPLRIPGATATPRGTLQVRPLGQRLPVGASEYTQYFPISFPKGCVLRCRQPSDYIRP